MTYDAKVYGARGPLSDPPLLGEYFVVLAADAEAHEKAAVEAALADGYHDCYIEHYPPAIREQAIRDCITAVVELTENGDSVRPGDVMYVLNALLEKQ